MGLLLESLFVCSLAEFEKKKKEKARREQEKERRQEEEEREERRKAEQVLLLILSPGVLESLFENCCHGSFEQDHKRQLDKARNGGSRERSR